MGGNYAAELGREALVVGPLLLDTCAALWLVEGSRVSRSAMSALADAERKGEKLSISPISAWEIGLLVSRGRINLMMRPEAYFHAMLRGPRVVLAALTPDVLIASSFLPDSRTLRDPADRIIAATAREFGYTVVTRDRALLAYCDEGHIQALEC